MGGGWQRRFGPYLDIARAAWQNRRQLPYAWRILRDGVCDGCALGQSGLRDWTMDGIHLCWLRLNLLRLNTMPPFDPGVAADASRLQGRSEGELRALGRLPVPLLRRRGDVGFRPLDWEEALELVGERLRRADPRRVAFYLTSRGTVNETYYVAQKVARFLGSNHIDNSARVCHAPSTVALKEALGYGASTCSYRDWLQSDLLVFLGSDLANNQPVAMKYVHLAKKRGAKVAVVNPFREPGLETYWVPSALDSALLGTRVADAFFQVKVGGDIAFCNGVLKHLLERGWLDEGFLAAHTSGWPEVAEAVAALSWPELERASGTSRQEMLAFARLYANAARAIFVWSMGITMHRYGVDNVRAIINLALARGMVGRPGTGLMAIRGHSGVQGGAEMGAVPNALPGGLPLNEETAASLAALWGFPVPSWRGYFVAEMVDAAWRGELDVLYCVGSNLLEVLPDRRYVREALARIPLRVHHDIVLNPQMLVEPGEEVLLLPATTRYEMAGGNTETTTERRVIFNPEVPGPRVPAARDEWRVLVAVAQRARPQAAHLLSFPSTQAIREEIARAVPFYEGIQRLRGKGDQFQWGGERLGEGGRFATADGRARLAPVPIPQEEAQEGLFRLTTRRGKQFNSMVFAQRDALVGAGRDEVLLAPQDMARLGLRPGQPLLLRSASGQFRGRARPGPVYPGTVLMSWPEANVLIPRGLSDPQCGIPAYRDAWVEVLPLEGAAPQG
jgi:molybdopterin-dependent oxidoreductase alpha subunit